MIVNASPLPLDLAAVSEADIFLSMVGWGEKDGEAILTEHNKGGR